MTYKDWPFCQSTLFAFASLASTTASSTGFGSTDETPTGSGADLDAGGRSRSRFAAGGSAIGGFTPGFAIGLYAFGSAFYGATGDTTTSFETGRETLYVK